MAILVCGGAGYIGSHVVKLLLERNREVIVIDNLVTGHVDAVDTRAILEIGDLRDKDFLNRVFLKYVKKIEGVINFAAYSLVGESVGNPIKYFDNNVGATVSLLEAMNKYNVKNIVFSSTAATYGEPKSVPIKETEETNPTNPYGESKLMVEKILDWESKANELKYIALRYFNVAGAYESGEIGEAHICETHLIPIILQVALGQREKISVFGDDYDTKDGTCIRDYIHVMDLAEAHILALDSLINGGNCGIFNLGNGEGFSVKEVIDIAKKVTRVSIPVEISARRAGDPAKLVASSQKAMDILKWKPKYTNIEDIIASAWKWHKLNPNGYND